MSKAIRLACHCAFGIRTGGLEGCRERQGVFIPWLFNFLSPPWGFWVLKFLLGRLVMCWSFCDEKWTGSLSWKDVWQSSRVVCSVMHSEQSPILHQHVAKSCATRSWDVSKRVTSVLFLNVRDKVLMPSYLYERVVMSLLLSSLCGLYSCSGIYTSTEDGPWLHVGKTSWSHGWVQ